MTAVHAQGRRARTPLRLALVLIATLAVALGACGGASDDSDDSASDRAGADEPIRIGFVGPFSGNFATSSVAVQQTLETWVNVTNEDGGILGREVEIVTQDDEGSPERAVQVTRELVEDGVGIIVGPVTNATALQPLQQDPSVEFINFTILPRPELDVGADFPRTFNTYPPNSLFVEYMAQTLADRGLTRWAVLADTTPQQQQYVTGFTEAAAEVGAEVVLTESFDPSSTDLSTQAQQLKGSDADAVLFFAVGGPVGRFMQAVQAAEVEQPIYAAGGISASDLTVAPPEVLENQVTVGIVRTSVLADGNPPEGYIPLTEALYEEFGKDAIGGSGMTIQFDTFDMIRFAIEESGSTDPDAMIEVMNTQVDDRSFLDPS